MRFTGTFMAKDTRGTDRCGTRSPAPKSRRRVTTAALLISGAALLSACEDGQGFDFLKTRPSADMAATPQTSTKIVERDVEAPDVFQVTDEGLWDGRPSLGGVWVAHGDVTDPERVIIRNEQNGKFVIGALFKRERSTPGPAIQVSSDAAEALGMLAGAPVTLNVTALRREEVAETEPAPQVDTLASTETIEAAPLDPIADAAATLDAIEAPTPPTAAPTPKPVVPKTAAAAGLTKPFIQIGIFSVKSNADRTIAMLGSQGLVATVKQGEMSGKAFWRVLVGPASSSDERKLLLDKVKKAGFTDAYFVTH